MSVERKGEHVMYAVLNGPRPGFPEWYRGTARFLPTHWDNLPEDSEANRLFFRYWESSADGIFEDEARLPELRYVVRVYNTLSPADRYEVVHLAPRRVAEGMRGDLFGIDLSQNGVGGSLLAGWGTPEFAQHPRSTADGAVVLARLIHDHFMPCLNRCGLFASFDDAEACLEAMTALRSLAPTIHELGTYAPVAVFADEARA